MKNGYIPYRRGIIEHFPKMKSSEVKLFDAYLTQANFRTAICDLSSVEIAKLIGWTPGNVSTFRNKLIKRMFIVPQKRGQSGVWIPKYPKMKGGGYVAPPDWAVEFMEKEWCDKLKKLKTTLIEYLKCDSPTLQQNYK